MTSQVFNEDCMALMSRYPDKYFDVCITDLPYGVGVEYGSFDDSAENTIALINSAMPEILRVSKRAIITSGTKLMWHYPKPDWVGCVYSPAGVGVGSHGFCCWQPILIYGCDPKLKDRQGSMPDSFTFSEGNDKESAFHPVPKPIKFWQKIFMRWTGKDDKLIFDPFTGSGTSRIIADKMGLSFVGCEIDKDYFEAQEKRWREYKAQLTLF